MSRTLVVLRCGRATTRPAWAAGAEGLGFDVVLCPYEPLAAEDAGRGTRPILGPKWAGLTAFLGETSGWRAYDWVWLPDDDLEATPEVVARFFGLCREHEAALAAPALAEGSSASHVVTCRSRTFTARRTTFVEVMAPCFRRDVLATLLPTFSASDTGHGWGLDDAWARLLGYRGIHTFDETPVLHARPVGSLRSPEEGERAKADMRRVRRRYDARSIRKTTAGLLPGLGWIDEGDARFLPALHEGYTGLFAADPDARRRLAEVQAQDPEGWLAGAERRARRRRRWAPLARLLGRDG